MGRAKGGKGYMAIKIDLEKAYDKIEWAFIREMLSSSISQIILLTPS